MGARGWRRLGLGLGIVIALCAVYVWSSLTMPYSEGERAGVLQRLSRRGWLCKTYEGELAVSTIPGSAPVIWSFSVRDDGIVPRLNAALGKRVVLEYAEHRGVPTTCFGETSSFVRGIRLQE